MKRKNFYSLLIVITLSMMLSNSNHVFSQTPGTLTFTYTQSPPTGSATKNIMAVWIEDSVTGAFIKTRMRFWGSVTTDHLPSWKAKSNQNLTDATTGATRTASTSPTAFGAKTINWDGTDVNGALVPDGTYTIFVESSYCNPEPANNQHWILTGFSFTKGANAVHLTPTGPVNFSNISLDWVPAASSVGNLSKNSDISVFPNPSNGVFNVDIKQAFTGTIKVETITGATVYSEDVSLSNAEVKTIDLSKFAKGTYYVNIQSKNSGESQKFKIVLTN